MVYILATASALANALTSILQRMGVEDAPQDHSMHLSLMTYALKRGVWMLGFLLMVGSFLFQAVALHFGPLSQVQPILTTELLFLVLLLATWFRFRVGWREWFGCLAAAGGLAGFLTFADPTEGSTPPSDLGWIVVGSICAAAVVALVLAALRGPRWWRAAMFGAAGAVGFAFTASLIKTVDGYVTTHWTSMFVHWQTYGLAGCGLASVFLAQNAFHAGPIAASQSTLVLVDPLASLAIGIGLFGDNLRTFGAYGPLEAVSLVLMFVGAVYLAQSPLVTGMKGEEDDKFAHMLAFRSRSKRLVHSAEEHLPPDVELPPDVAEHLP